MTDIRHASEYSKYTEIFIMKFTVYSKIITNAIIGTLILIIMSALVSFALDQMSALHDTVVSVSTTSAQASEANLYDDQLYGVMMAGIASRDAKTTEKVYADTRDHDLVTLKELNDAADRDDEKSAMKKANSGFSDLTHIFEGKFLPALKDGKDAKTLSEISDEFHALQDPYSAGLSDMVRIQKAQLDEANEAYAAKKTWTNYSNYAIDAIGVATAIGMMLWLIRSVSIPVKKLTAAMSRLAEGDKSVAIPATDRKDEIGQMAQTVLVFRENMLRVDQMSQDQISRMNAESEKNENLERTIKEFDRKVGQIVNTVASAATELQVNAESLTDISTQTNERTTAVAAATEEASASVQAVAAATEELSASIGEISRRVSESASVTKNAVTEVSHTDTTVSTLAEAANQIGDVVKLIQNIAKQTNLLALNATIEAARAGEAGKGFAVVASEVKNLANQTAQATEEISQKIVMIQNVSGEAAIAIQGIGKTINQLSAISGGIATAIQQQDSATREISANVQQASVGTNEVSANIVTVTDAAARSLGSSGEVLQASKELAQQAEFLRAEVQDFLSQVQQG